MKSMIKRIIVGVSIGLILSFVNACEVHAEQQVVFKKPLQNYISFCNIADKSICNYSLTSTINEFVYLQSQFYRVDITKPNNYFIGRVSWQYDLSDITEPYISFTIYNELVEPNIVLDGVACETYRGNYYFLNNFNGDYEYSNFPNGYTIAVCPNTKSSDSWLDIYHNDLANASSTTYSALILNWINSYDKYSSISSSIKETTDAIKETNNLIKDSTVPSNNNISNAIDSNKVQPPSNVTDLINILPNTLNVIINGFNNSCAGGYSLGTLFGTELIIPCINPVNYLGTYIWGVIDAILCLCFIIPFSKFLVNLYNDFTSLKNRRLM